MPVDPEIMALVMTSELRGSKAFKKQELPIEVRCRVDDAMAEKMTIIVREAPGKTGFFKTT